MAPGKLLKPKLKEANHHRQCFFQCWTKILPALICILISSGPSPCDATQERCIQIPALKRTVELGDLYDEKTDSLIPVGVFRRTIPKEFITQIQNPTRRTYTEITDSLIDQFNLFGIDKNAGVNILSGITRPKGALSIFQGKTQKSSLMTGTLFYEYETVVQKLYLFQDGLKDLYNKDIMGHKDATHVVTQISWGSQVAVQVQMKPDSITMKKNYTRTERKLIKAELRSLRGQLTAEDDHPSNFLMTVTSDIPLSQEIPTTAKQVKEMLSQVPNFVADLNEGKGVPLSYSLTPINQIREHLGVHPQNTTAHTLNEFTLNELIEVFQNLQSAEVQLGQLNDRIKTYPNCIPQETGFKLIDLLSKFRNFKSNFTTTVKNSLIQVRSGLGENTILTDLVDQFLESDFEPGNIRLQVQAFDRDVEKIDFCTDFQNKFTSVKYFGAVGPEEQKENLLNSLNVIVNNSHIPVVMLLTKFELIQKEPATYTEKFGLFLRKMNGTPSTAVFIDCDFLYPFCENLTETSIVEYRNGSIQILQGNSMESLPLCSQGSCLNGGTCIEKGEEISCECAAGFIGKSCEDIECALPGTCHSVLTKPPSCKCRPGYVKDARDRAKCQSSNSNNATLLFADNAGIQQLSIGQRNTTRLVSDTSLRFALDFHYLNKRMFWSGPDNTIYSAPISAGASKTLVFTDTGALILSIAIDWVHHHLYYTDANKDKISVANLDGSMKKVLINDGLSYPTSIVVNPSNGWMYWVDQGLKKIERAGMDGSQRQTIATTTDSPWGLAIDYTENRLYWTTYSPHPCSIHSMNIDGSDQKLVLRAAAPTFSSSQFYSIAIFEDYVYWRDGSTQKMYRANKCNGAELTELISNLSNNYREVRVYHFSKQPEFTNECAGRTQQCSHLCLPIPRIENVTLSTICECPEGRTLSSDGHNCS